MAKDIPSKSTTDVSLADLQQGAEAPAPAVVAAPAPVTLSVPATVVNVPPQAVTIGGQLATPASGGSYRIARDGAELTQVVKSPNGADPTRDPDAARPKRQDAGSA